MARQKKKNTVSGLAELSSATNLDINLLKIVKKHPRMVSENVFQTNGRIDIDKFKSIYEEIKDDISLEDVEDAEKWKMMKLKFDALISEIEYDELQKKFVKREEVEEAIAGIANAQRNLLKQKLTSELPVKLTGLSAPEIQQIMDGLVNDICDLMQTIKI
jgi:hypothetical protein